MISLDDAVAKGKFREDLYYRLNTVPIYVPPLRQRGNDIHLLFRKFAGDFSDKYKTKPVLLTDDAIQQLIRYDFPGNIRQLKNIVEQISVLELSKTVNLETLQKYLPSATSRVPMLYKGDKDDNISERDILYKILFDLKSDVTDLKKLVHDILSHDEKQGIERPILEDYNHLLKSGKETPATEPEPVVLEIDNQDTKSYTLDRVEDISHEYEDDDSLSIEKKEKELIIKALRKNSNKRKYAAQDLGISERTLYRKIKQYEIDE